MSARGAKQFAKVGLPVVLFCCGGMLMLKQVRDFVCLFSLSHFFRSLEKKRSPQSTRSSSTGSWSFRVNVRRVDRKEKLNLRMSTIK